ncbi:hypothetical protein AC579_552 [Pseudocercospora musae]|uniref:YMC020W-like alpha/beta hydrolase domain-containing protein n=1 Tax=Pseudocercospora musae TaxID=113226 RepID=A0A139IRU3_9PEZI|nr:hypothetical protein AC579_552 [Pseudocercospora musae]
MAPARKRSKLAESNEGGVQSGKNTPIEDNHESLTADTATLASSSKDAATAPVEETGSPVQAQAPTQAQANGNQVQRGSWYTSAWRSKASPVTQSSRETISVDKGVPSESSYLGGQASRRPSASVSKSFKGSNRKSSALIAEATKVHAVGDAVSVPKNKQRQTRDAEEKARSTEKPVPEQVKKEEVVEQAPLPPEPEMVEDDAKTETGSVRQASGSWFGWWSRPDGYDSNGDKVKDGGQLALHGAIEQRKNTPLPATPEQTSQEPATVQAETQVEQDISSQLQPEMSTKYGSTRSWFGLWSNTQNQQAAVEEQQRREAEQQKSDQSPAQQKVPETAPDVAVTADASKTAKDTKSAEPSKRKDYEEQPKSSGWAFWSKEKTKDGTKGEEETQKQIGELAVADTPSQSHPEAAQYNQQPDRKVEVQRSGSLLRRKRGRPESKDVSGETTAAATPAGSQLQTPAGTQFHTPIDTPEASPAPLQRGKTPQLRPNIISPSFRETYPKVAHHGYLDRITHYIGQSLRLTEARKPAMHPCISEQPHRIKKAIAIGIHGFFPAALLQRVLGQPTGTSIRFANYAAASIKHWCQEHQPSIKDVEVEKVALEGEGLVGDRVSTLWKLLLNWLSHLRQADFILVACHSQGVPVAVMLVAKLIQLGVLSSNARIGMCAMAGINLGPFLEYKSRFYSGSALELFDFCDSRSRVSLTYTDALEVCLRHGVRITFVGSLDDQLVSLESSLHTPLSHPYVSRAIFIDGRLHTSNFLIHLVTFAAKLRNLGVSDHGLIREISAPLAGSIVGGEGHSRVYDDPAVYRSAIEFALESTDVSPSIFAALRPTTADEQRKSMEDAASRRSSLAGYPSNMVAANHMRRGSLGALSLAPQGIAPVIAPYEALGAAGSAEKNPFVLPWAVRGMLEEDLVKSDGRLQAEVRGLVREFEEWKPTSKVLKDVRWRLEGVRSMR